MEKNFIWWIELVSVITVFVLGLVGNIFVLIILHAKNARKTVHGIFVTCLAVADLVLLCFDSPVSILGKFNVASKTFNCRINIHINIHIILCAIVVKIQSEKEALNVLELRKYYDNGSIMIMTYLTTHTSSTDTTT